MTRDQILIWIEKTQNRIIKAASALVFVMFLSIVCMVFISIISRYIFNAPGNFSEQLSKFLMNWFAFIAGGIALRQGAHISIDAITKKFPLQAQKYLALIITVVSCIFFAVVIYHGTMFSWRARFNVEPMVWNLSMGFIYMSVPVGFAFMMLEQILVTLQFWLSGKEPRTDGSII